MKVKSNKKTENKDEKKKKKNHGVSKRKTKKRNERNYTAESVQDALNAMGEGQTLRQAASNFGVPKSTLFLKYKNILPIQCKKGPKPVLSEELEEEIASWIIFNAESGFPVNKSRLLDCIEKYLNANKIKTVFKKNRPGAHWYKSFMERHPHLSTRIAQNLTTTRAAVSEEGLRSWFSKVKNYLEEKDLLNIPPDRIFNLDESAFMLVPKDTKVITEKGAKAPYQIVSSNDKTSITVLFTTSATGVMPPPMILFDLKTTPKKNVLEKIPKGWGVGNSERGWMTAETFYSYMKNVFYKWLVENGYQFPIILYVDGHSSHMTFQLLKFCKEHLIELIVLFPNATHVIQPLDVAVFHPLKNTYRSVLRQWRIENDIVEVKKYMFAPILKMALDSHDLTEAIKNGFRTCGLYPFNADAVNYNILSKKTKKKDSTVPDSTQNPSNNPISTDNDVCLRTLEKNMIPQDILQSFKEAESDVVWHGDIEYAALFETWRKLRRLCAGMDDSTATKPPHTDESSATDPPRTHESSETDHLDFDDSSAADQPHPDVQSNENEESNILPPVMSDDAMPESTNTVVDTSYPVPYVLGFSDNLQSKESTIISQEDDNAIDCYALNSITAQDVQLDFSVTDSEIVLYDELGNRIGTAIAVVDNDEGMEKNIMYTSTPECTIATNQDEIQKELQVPTTVPVAMTTSDKTEPCVQKNFSTATSDKAPECSTDTVPCEEQNYSAPITTLQETSASSVLREINLSSHANLQTEPTKQSLNHSSINEESNSSSCSTENKAVASPFKEIFPVPTFTPKASRKSVSENTPSVAVVDNLLAVLEQKEQEKRRKEQQIQQNKLEREKAKQYNEKRKRKLQEKKDIKSQIQQLKKAIKSEKTKENVASLTEKMDNMTAELAALENSIIQDEMEFLQTKIKIKKEAV